MITLYDIPVGVSGPHLHLTEHTARKLNLNVEDVGRELRQSGNYILNQRPIVQCPGYAFGHRLAVIVPCRTYDVIEIPRLLNDTIPILDTTDCDKSDRNGYIYEWDPENADKDYITHPYKGLVLKAPVIHTRPHIHVRHPELYEAANVRFGSVAIRLDVKGGTVPEIHIDATEQKFYSAPATADVVLRLKHQS